MRLEKRERKNLQKRSELRRTFKERIDLVESIGRNAERTHNPRNLILEMNYRKAELDRERGEER